MSEKIAVGGSGQMGNGIAHVFAVAGFDVTMIDVSRAALERARATIEKNLARQVEKKIIEATERDAALARIGINESLQSAADAALMCGLAYLNKSSVGVLGHKKGRTLQEALKQNFGMPHPEGYRKALRLMKLAEQFKLPLLAFVDTAGAYPGIGAEERHIAEAIAVNLREMMLFEVPIIAIVIGEGGSGGALGIGVADRVLILENAYYSVISPEGCAAILWKDRSAASKAAEALKITAKHLLELGLVDDIVPEPLGGAHTSPEKTAASLKEFPSTFRGHH